MLLMPLLVADARHLVRCSIALISFAYRAPTPGPVSLQLRNRQPRFSHTSPNRVHHHVPHRVQPVIESYAVSELALSTTYNSIS